MKPAPWPARCPAADRLGIFDVGEYCLRHALTLLPTLNREREVRTRGPHAHVAAHAAAAL